MSASPRGLGDVYKRQLLVVAIGAQIAKNGAERSERQLQGWSVEADCGMAVSYTHLTLPTICSV
eukprot:10942721-Alexandrium_andersonii.AAC.1